MTRQISERAGRDTHIFQKQPFLHGVYFEISHKGITAM